MITDRDRKIINYIYENSYLTIEQVGKLFFGDFKTSYDLARRRLKKIVANGGYIKAIKNVETNQLLYVPIDSKVKKVSKHNLLIIDYMCELKLLGANIEVFKREKTFDKVIADAFIQFTFGGYRYYQLLEVQLGHYSVDVNRYKPYMNSILKETNNTIPKLIIVQNTQKNYNLENKTDMDIVHLNTHLDDLAKVMI